MAMNVKCPKCGSTKVQLSNEEHKHHGLLWWACIGWWWWLAGIVCRLVLSMMVLCCVDWWMAIIKAIQKKGYQWKFKSFLTMRKRIYYCHDCGHNFKG